jgi:hypothetical protein
MDSNEKLQWQGMFRGILERNSSQSTTRVHSTCLSPPALASCCAPSWSFSFFPLYRVYFSKWGGRGLRFIYLFIYFGNRNLSYTPTQSPHPRRQMIKERSRDPQGANTNPNVGKVHTAQETLKLYNDLTITYDDKWAVESQSKSGAWYESGLWYEETLSYCEFSPNT